MRQNNRISFCYWIIGDFGSVRIAMQSENNWLHVHSWNNIPVCYSPFTLPISILISFDFDFIVDCYVCIFPSSLMSTGQWAVLRLRCVDLTPYCRHIMISAMGSGYVFEVAIEERVISQRKFYQTMKSTERMLKFHVKSDGTQPTVSDKTNKNKKNTKETMDLDATYIHLAFSYTM